METIGDMAQKMGENNTNYGKEQIEVGSEKADNLKLKINYREDTKLKTNEK